MPEMRTRWIALALVLAIGIWAIGSLGKSAEPAAGPPPGSTATSAKVSPAPTKKETKAEAIALSLAAVVKAINEQARKLPETRRLTRMLFLMIIDSSGKSALSAVNPFTRLSTVLCSLPERTGKAIQRAWNGQIFLKKFPVA